MDLIQCKKYRKTLFLEKNDLRPFANISTDFIHITRAIFEILELSIHRNFATTYLAITNVISISSSKSSPPPSRQTYTLNNTEKVTRHALILARDTRGKYFLASTWASMKPLQNPVKKKSERKRKAKAVGTYIHASPSTRNKQTMRFPQPLSTHNAIITQKRASLYVRITTYTHPYTYIYTFTFSFASARASYLAEIEAGKGGELGGEREGGRCAV